jgi:integral membrane protein
MTHTAEKPVAGVKDLEKLPAALSFYRFAAWVTGLLLLALAVEMVAKYGFGREVEMLGPSGFLTLTPTGEVEGINISRATVIAHGWFYVVYLFSCFRVWSKIRWPFWRFLWLASGGLFPVFSFVIEHYATRVVRREIEAATPVSSSS